MNRRDWLKTAGGLVVGFTFGGVPAFGRQAVPASPFGNDGRSLDPKDVDSFLSIDPDGSVTVYTSKVDVGTGMNPVIGELEMVTDGEKSGADGYFIELGPGVQWVQIDLGASHTLSAILAWHYHSQARIYRDVIVQASDDPAFKTGVTTIFNNDHDNSSKMGQGQDKEYIEVAEGKLFDPKGAKGRYVRLYSNGNTTNDLNHYVEVEVFGLPK